MKIYTSMALILAFLVISVSGCVENNTNESVVHILCKIGNLDENCGTGFVIRDDGYILTVFHVVVNDVLDIRINNMKENFTIVLTNGKELKVVNSFNITENLFIIKVDATLKPVRFDDSNSQNNNSNVIIFGYPEGVLKENSGTIIGEGQYNLNDSGTVRHFPNLYIINTSLSTIGGYSGGPVFLNNKLIGISNANTSYFAGIVCDIVIPVNSSILDYINEHDLWRTQ
jgi:S1-C subfamily serine protease